MLEMPPPVVPHPKPVATTYNTASSSGQIVPATALRNQDRFVTIAMTSNAQPKSANRLAIRKPTAGPLN